MPNSALAKRTPPGSASAIFNYLLLATLVVPLLALGVGGYLSYRAQLADAWTNLERKVDVVHEHALKVFETLDLAALQVSQLMSGLSDAEIREREAEMHGRIRALIGRLRQLQFVLALDRDGRILVSSAASPPPQGLVYTDRDYFRVFARDEMPPGAIYITDVLRGRLNPNEAFFGVAMRRSPADRPFDGVVSVSAQSGYFSAFYRDLARDEGIDTATMLRADGTILARFPEAGPSAPARVAPTTTLMQAIGRQPVRGLYEATSVVDNTRRLYAYRQLAERPVYVTVGIDRASVLAKWQASMASHLFFGVPATLSLFLIALAAKRKAQREARAVAQLAEASRERDQIWRVSHDGLAVMDMDGVFHSVSPGFGRSLGWAIRDIEGQSYRAFVHPDDVDATAEQVGALASGQSTYQFENRFRHADGSYRWLSWTAVPEDGLIYAVARDVTDQKSAAAELALAQDALRQAQKMEAVGQLTGGIAHDFNNMLAIVVGSLGMLRRRIDEGDSRLVRLIDNAQEGAKRAAALTARLLAFSRQQTLQPESIDANQLILGMSELLQRTLTESIRLETTLASGLWRTFADPHQLESAILNLAVNARDAMLNGGRLTIETANCDLDNDRARALFGVPAGQYVMVAVTDTGSGMPADVVARAFEPFFTTKEVGKGTGLGLSMVYGFVQQSGGHARIYSEPGHGTTVKIYLPRQADAEGPAGTARIAPGASLPRASDRQVILVVEDEPAVRSLSVETLGELGYQVLEAALAADALRVLDNRPDVALLFTDVVMPDMNGVDLAVEARRRRPDLRVLFTTGFPRNAMIANAGLEPEGHVLPKPFTVEQLAQKVFEAMSGDSRSEALDQ